MGTRIGDFSSGLNELASVNSLLAKMIEEKKVDKTILGPLDSLIKLFKEKEEYWRANEKISQKSAFPIYHAWRNLRLISSKMRTRFMEAEKLHENPKTVDESLNVIPSLLHAYTILIEFGEKELSREESAEAFNQVRVLRNAAYHARMLPSIQEEVKEVDGKVVIAEFEKFAKGIRESETTTESSSGN